MTECGTLADRLERLLAKSTPGPYERQGRRIACAPDERGHQHTLAKLPNHNASAHSRLLCELVNNIPLIVSALRHALGEITKTAKEG